MFVAIQFLNVLILTLLCVQLFKSVKVSDLPPVWKRGSYLAFHVLFRRLLRYIYPSFPLMFWTVPEVSLLV